MEKRKQLDIISLPDSLLNKRQRCKSEGNENCEPFFVQISIFSLFSAKYWFSICFLNHFMQ